ncbi:hypothetical protein TNCV_3077381 [Trichonephila clavipes]|nr:hypothetical protein TNCV_3077381 [Trichonephila clavipes]
MTENWVANIESLRSTELNSPLKLHRPTFYCWSSGFDKPAALAVSWKVEFLVQLVVNIYSHETTSLFSSNDSSPGNRYDILLRVSPIIFYRKALGCQFRAYDTYEIWQPAW